MTDVTVNFATLRSSATSIDAATDEQLNPQTRRQLNRILTDAARWCFAELPRSGSAC